LKNSKKGTIIHFYDFSQEKDFPEQSINKIKSKKIAMPRMKFRVPLPVLEKLREELL